MEYSAEAVLANLLACPAQRTSDAPRDCRGIYGLIDHLGALCYIGSTSAENETLYKRIHQRHRTGSENTSHYFSRMYNTGRMWRDRDDPSHSADARIAKELRNAFIAEHCRAVWVVVPDHLDIHMLEQAILKIAPKENTAWNARGTPIYEEPHALVDATLASLRWDADQTAACERQAARSFGKVGVASTHKIADAATTLSAIKPLPLGPFRFFALDVETANNDRSSICQIGIACVRSNGDIETWSSYVDPKTTDWSCSFVHKISGKKVRGAPTFVQILPMINALLCEQIVYQHSSFDQSAVASACATNGLPMPTWRWQDSVAVARRAWPELKGQGGHGLASLKKHLGLNFMHHDAEEDARASAEIVLLAEKGIQIQSPPHRMSDTMAVVFGASEDLIEAFDVPASISEIASESLDAGMTHTSQNVKSAELSEQGRVQDEVPVSKDGSVFHSGLMRAGHFQIGEKGAEIKVSSFAEALRALREMDTPRWRRPNAAGNWGIVAGCRWKLVGA